MQSAPFVHTYNTALHRNGSSQGKAAAEAAAAAAAAEHSVLQPGSEQRPKWSQQTPLPGCTAGTAACETQHSMHSYVCWRARWVLLCEPVHTQHAMACAPGQLAGRW
jgi:hypothetical protein